MVNKYKPTKRSVYGSAVTANPKIFLKFLKLCLRGSHMIRTNQTYLRATQKSPDQWRLGGPKSENYVINARPMNALHFVPLFLHQKSARIFSASASFHSTFKVLKMAKFLENSRWYQAYKELASQGKLQLPEYEQVSDNHCNLQVFWKCLYIKYLEWKWGVSGETRRVVLSLPRLW